MPVTEGSGLRGTGLLGRLIAGSARNPWLTVALAAGLGLWGWWAMRAAPLDAIPDLSDVQVIIQTEWGGRSPDLVEDQITYPITSRLVAAPRVRFVRGQSFFGVSFVYVVFEDGTDIYWARSRVLEYLNTVQADLPAGVAPTLGPDATGVGWVFQYALLDRTGGHDLQQLRSIQDWNVRFALESVEGVAEVGSIGGFVKEYQVLLDPVRLLGHSITLSEVIRAVRASNEDAGGHTIEIAGHEHMIRGRGYLRGLDDLGGIPLRATPDGTPVRLRDVAEVEIGPASRRGIAELDGQGEVAGGIVIMRYGENALRVIDRVKARLEEVRRSLPEGVELVVTYDRSELIKASIETLKRTLLEEMVIVSLVIFLFLMHARSALVPVIALPLAVLAAFVPMFYQGLTANIMSLGGIAVALGAMVDASIIIIENIHQRLSEWEERGRVEPRLEVLIGAMQEVGPSIFFSLLVITVSFLPVFTLQATEGRLFRPLAFTKTYSMGFAAILAVTLTPALAALLIRGRLRREEHDVLNRWLVRLYEPVVRIVIRWRWVVIAGALLLVTATIPVFLRLKSEFMPPLNEGAILYMPTSPPGMSATEAANALQLLDRELRRFPEVERVFGKMGRAQTATDPAPLDMAEITVVLKPRDQWRQGLTWDDLVREMDEEVRIPGMPNVWWMPIQTRTEMLATGIRSPLGIKVYGDDLETIERAARSVEDALADVPGTRSAYAERSTGGNYLDFDIDREAAARFGLSVADINEVIMTAVGGMSVTQTVEGRERYPVSIRYAREWRDEPDQLERILVPTPTGVQIPISQVARIVHRTGPPMIRSEDGKLLGFVFVDIADRPIADYVHQARRVVARDLTLPPGVRLEWAGQFTYLERAKQRLRLIVPITLALVLFLLYANTRSVTEAGIVLLAVPFSLVGAFWLLFLLGYHLSVAVWVGLIALAGLDAETGVVMLLYLKLAHRRRREEGRLATTADLTEAIVEGSARRIRPKLMTVLTTMIALLPIMWSAGTGADVMRRIAAPMIGGLVTSFLLELTVYPAIFAVWKRRGLPAG